MERIVNVITRILAVAEAAADSSLGRPAKTIATESLSEYVPIVSSGNIGVEKKVDKESPVEGTVVGKLTTPSETFYMLRVPAEIHRRLPEYLSDVLMRKEENITINRLGRKNRRAAVDYLIYGELSHPEF